MAKAVRRTGVMKHEHGDRTHCFRSF
jgi:hypothetical protein